MVEQLRITERVMAEHMPRVDRLVDGRLLDALDGCQVFDVFLQKADAADHEQVVQVCEMPVEHRGVAPHSLGDFANRDVLYSLFLNHFASDVDVFLLRVMSVAFLHPCSRFDEIRFAAAIVGEACELLAKPYSITKVIALT